MSCLTRIGCLLAASAPLAFSASDAFFVGGGEPCELYTRVVNRSECERAAADLGFTYNSFSADLYPPGCQFAPEGSGHPIADGVLWNADNTGSWRGIGSLKAVCEKRTLDNPPEFSALPRQRCDQAYRIESLSECERAADYLRIRFDGINAASRPRGCYIEEDLRFPVLTGRYDVVYWNSVFPEDPPVGFGLAAVCEGGQPTWAPTAAPTAAAPTSAPTPAPMVPTSAPTTAPTQSRDTSSASVHLPASLWSGAWGLFWAAWTS